MFYETEKKSSEIERRMQLDVGLQRVNGCKDLSLVGVNWYNSCCSL